MSDVDKQIRTKSFVSRVAETTIPTLADAGSIDGERRADGSLLRGFPDPRSFPGSARKTAFVACLLMARQHQPQRSIRSADGHGGGHGRSAIIFKEISMSAVLEQIESPAAAQTPAASDRLAEVTEITEVTEIIPQW